MNNKFKVKDTAAVADSNNDKNSHVSSHKDVDLCDIRELPLHKHFSSEIIQSAKQFLFYSTKDNGKSFFLKNDAKDFKNYTKSDPVVFKSKDSFDLFNKKVLPHLTQVFNQNKPAYLLFEIRSNKNPSIQIEVNIDKVSDNELVIFVKEISGLLNTMASFEANRRSLNELQDTVPVGLFQVDDHGVIKYANDWFVKILGESSKDDLIGANFKDYFEEPKEAEKYFSSILSKNHAGEKQVLLSNRKNEKVWVVISAEKDDDVCKKSTCIDGFMYDITERKQVLEQLKESEHMFRAMSNNMESALYIFNQKGKFIYCNPAASEISGYSEEEILNMNFYDLIKPELQSPAIDRGMDRLDGKDVPRIYETKVLTRDGQEKWLEIASSKLVLNGEPAVMGLANDITERKQSIELIRSNKEKYKSLYSFIRLMADNVPDLIWAKNLDGEYIFANKALCDKLLLAKDTDEPVGKTDMYFAERERRNNTKRPNWYTFGEISAESDSIVLRSELSHHVDEYGYVKGRFMYLDVYKSPLYDDTGNLIGLVGSGRDVTEQKKLEQEKLREETLKHVVYKIGNAVNTTKDLNELFTVIRLEISQVIDTTNMYIALYDKEKDSLSLPYFIDEKDRFGTIPNTKSLTHHLIKTRKPLLLKEEDYYNLAEENQIEILGTPAKVWLGVPLQVNSETIGVLVVQDYHNEDAFEEKDLDLLKFVSMQISISISQKKADDALRENEFALRQIIDNVPVMIFAKDKAKRFVLANREFAKSYGKHVNMIEGKKQSEIHLYEDELTRYITDDEMVLNKRESVFNANESFTNHNGDRRILQTVRIPINTDTEKGIAILGVAIDITERNKVEAELTRAKEKAEESDRLKTAFLANMSHEIRTPMNAIIGFSELLNDSSLAADSRREFISLIADNSKALLKLIEDIIDVSKIEAKQVTIVKSTCQVNQILTELQKSGTELLKKQNNKKLNIKINLPVSDYNFSIESDPFRFKQIINNLVDNAIKFTENGFVEIGYRIQKEDTILFFVKDTGIGLADDKISFIFERFRQAEESSTKEYRGTGLGLTIASRLVELLGGELWVDSKLGEGSTFYFSLPFISKKATGKLKPLIGQKGKKDWAGKTILVAEDEISNYELIKATLFRSKVKLIRARNGVEAVAMFKESPNINLILMDIRMPEMNGYEATRIIKSIRKDIPVISLTAYAMAEDREKSVAAGCDEYISKPFNPSELIEKIDELIK